jgi:FG-GAP-like repeat
MSESSDIKAGDLDGDGDLDLAVVSIGSSLENNVIDLYFNDGLGAFTRRTDAGGIGPQKMTLADLDGDGDLDIAMSSSYFENVMSVVLNDGDGTFAPERRYTVGDHPKGIASADFDGDGDLDLAIARNESATIQTKVQFWRNDDAANSARPRRSLRSNRAIHRWLRTTSIWMAGMTSSSEWWGPTIR